MPSLKEILFIKNKSIRIHKFLNMRNHSHAVSIHLVKSNAQIKTKIANISFKCLLLPQFFKFVFLQRDKKAQPLHQNPFN
jgi:hypothetical protein